MTRLPRLTGPELVAALAKAGFHVVRVKGSHHFLRHQDGRSAVIPAHPGEVPGAGDDRASLDVLIGSDLSC